TYTLFPYTTLFRSQPLHVPPELPVVVAHEEIHQRGHVLFPFPQRRKKNGNDGQPVIQVLPKMTLAYRALQVAIRGRDHANVHLDVAHTTDAPDHLLP